MRYIAKHLSYALYASKFEKGGPLEAHTPISEKEYAAEHGSADGPIFEYQAFGTTEEVEKAEAEEKVANPLVAIYAGKSDEVKGWELPAQAKQLVESGEFKEIDEDVLMKQIAFQQSKLEKINKG